MNTSEIQDSLRRIIANDNCTTEQLIDRLFDFVDARVQEAEKVPSAPAPMAEGLREAIVRAIETVYGGRVSEDGIDTILTAVAPFVGTEDGELLDWLEGEIKREMGCLMVPQKTISLFRRNEPITRATIRAARQSAQGGTQ